MTEGRISQALKSTEKTGVRFHFYRRVLRCVLLLGLTALPLGGMPVVQAGALPPAPALLPGSHPESNHTPLPTGDKQQEYTSSR
jgi:hypothetical protein